MYPAIVISGHTMGLGVVRALGEASLPVYLFRHDDRDMAQASRYVDLCRKIPHPDKEEASFIEHLMGAPFGPGVLIPTSDEAVVAVSRHKEKLAQIYTVACTDWEITKLFIDKRYTYEIADKSGVPAPRTLVPKHLDEVTEYANRCNYPCLVKPCQSHLFYEKFGCKMIRVDNASELLAGYEKVTLSGLQVMLQELIPGDDSEVVNYNAYFWGGEPLVEFTAAHVRNAPPCFGSPRVAVSRLISEVYEPGRKILKELKFSGYACTEFKRDPRDGVYKLMEVNGRHNLSTLLAVRCGINFPLIHYRHLTGIETPQQKDFREGVYWVDILRDVAYSVAFYRQERYPWRKYFTPYFSHKVFAILDRHDLKPFVRRVCNLVMSALTKPFKQRSREHTRKSHVGEQQVRATISGRKS